MNLGLPSSSGSNETSQVPLTLTVIKEEECGHIIWQHDEGKLVADLHCKTESDFTETLSTNCSELLQTKVGVKKEEDEQEHQDCDSPQETSRAFTSPSGTPTESRVGSVRRSQRQAPVLQSKVPRADSDQSGGGDPVESGDGQGGREQDPTAERPGVSGVSKRERLKQQKDQSNIHMRGGSLRKRPRVSYAEEEEPKDEDRLYCEDCESFYIDECGVHGPPNFIPDTPAPAGVPDRARLTLPPGLVVRESNIPNAGLGVFNQGQTVPRGAHFGPYEGEVMDRDEAIESGYSWVINKSRHADQYIDAKRETHSNWMRYVNCARDGEGQNLVAFQYRGGIVYRCCKPIAPGEELLLWYGEDYARDLGIGFDYLWDIKSSAKGVTASPVFSCTLCPISYTDQIYLHQHIKRSHTVEYMRLLTSGEIRPETLTPSASSGGSNQHTQKNLTLKSRSTSNNFTHPSSKQEGVDGEIRIDTLAPASSLSSKLCPVVVLKRLCTHTHSHTQTLSYKHTQHTRTVTHPSSKQARADGEIRPETLAPASSWSSKLCPVVVLKRLCTHTHSHTHTDTHHTRTLTDPSLKQEEFDDNRSYRYIHTEEKPYQCTQCDKSFKWKNEVKKHQRIHTGERPYTCTHCGKGFISLSSFKLHRRIHTGEKPYKCTECGLSFMRNDRFEQHQHIHTGKRPYNCTQCGKGFILEGNLKIHQRTHTGERPYTCTECGKTFAESGSLKIHSRSHTGEKPYHCTECGQSFLLSNGLKVHLRIHTGERPYICTQCGKSFNREEHFKLHQRVHTGERPYTCTHCGKSFSQKTHLRQHQRIHTGEKPYTCTQCDKSFVTLSGLKVHQTLHTGERPYHCTQCGKSFSRQDKLKQHKRIHTGERPYHCTQCGKTFTLGDDLKKHWRVHTGEKPYHCTECDKSFSGRGGLREHRRLHTGERPYTCTQCGKSFMRKDSLTLHQRIHTGEKPYTCTQCGKSFIRKAHLKLHQRIHTGQRLQPRGKPQTTPSHSRRKEDVALH